VRFRDGSAIRKLRHTEHSSVNRRVASSNLARGANFSFFLNYLQTATFSSSSFWRQTVTEM
jgi:hypothetical protein